MGSRWRNSKDGFCWPNTYALIYVDLFQKLPRLFESKLGSTRGKVKTGRRPKWTASRERALARLYLYTSLPPKDIRRVLQDEDNNFKPL